MSKFLTGKTALITGSTSGIGLAYAKATRTRSRRNGRASKRSPARRRSIRAMT